MIVEPPPARPPGRRPPVVAAAVGLVAVLVVVIVGGSLGPDAPPPPPDVVARDDEARTDRSAGPSDGPPDAAVALDPAFPKEVIGLPVRDVVAVVDGRRAEGMTGLVAVAGYLTVAGRPSECLPAVTGSPTLAAGRARPFCRREAVIASTPQGASGDPQREPSAWARGPHLHAQIVPGTSLPYTVEPPFGNDRRDGVPVVVLASFDDGRARTIGCGQEVFYCFETLTIERVLWADGRWQERRRALDPGLETAPRLGGRERLVITSTALPGSGPVLGEALLRREALELVDPVAHTEAGPTERPVWYLRLLASPSSDCERRVAWLVVEDVSGRILARGEAG
jgi:hypothetical protein